MEDALERMELFSIKARSLADDMDVLSHLTRDASLSTSGFRDIMRSLGAILHPLQASLTTITASVQTIHNNLTGAAGLSSAISGATEKINKATENLTNQQVQQNTKRNQNEEASQRETRSAMDRFRQKIVQAFSPLSIFGTALVAASAQILLMQRNLSGFDVSQRLFEMGHSVITSVADVFRQGIFLTAGTQARLRMIGTREFGGPTPERIRAEMARTTQLGINAEAAARLEGMMYRVSGYSQTSATNLSKMIVAMAHANNIGADDLMRELASNAALLANAANRVPESLARAAIQAQRIGVSMQGAEGFANKITGDFDTYLEMQAKLQTVMPGLDLTNVMIASQFGSTGDVIQAIQGAFGGRDIGQMPRSIRQMITSTTGISEEELVKYAQGGKSTAVKGATPAEIDRQQNTWRNNLLNAIQAAIPNLLKFIMAGVGGIALWSAVTAKNTTLLASQGTAGAIASHWKQLFGFRGGAGSAEKVAERGIGLESPAEAVMRVNQASRIGRLAAARNMLNMGALGRMAVPFAGQGVTMGSGVGAAGLGTTFGVAGAGLLAGLGIGEVINHLTGTASLTDMMKLHETSVAGDMQQASINRMLQNRVTQHEAIIASHERVMPQRPITREEQKTSLG